MATQKKNLAANQMVHRLIYGGLALLAVFGLLRYLILSPPWGIKALDSIDLHQIQGPWFEVAHLDSPLEKDLNHPTLFIKYAGAGGDGFFPYPDPSDPRFRIVLMGQSANGSRVTALDTMSYKVDDYQSSTLILACPNGLPCAFHIIDYDQENHTWMVVTGRSKDQLWIFSRGPGILPFVLDKIKDKLSGLGYDVDALVYGNVLPKIPDVLPPIPEILPTPPGFKP